MYLYGFVEEVTSWRNAADGRLIFLSRWFISCSSQRLD